MSKTKTPLSIYTGNCLPLGANFGEHKINFSIYNKNATSGVKNPCTFFGLIEKIPYLKSLGITTFELLLNSFRLPNVLICTLILILSVSCSTDEIGTPPSQLVEYSIIIKAEEGGSVSTAGGKYEKGKTVSVTAIPQGEYVFTGWSDGNTNETRIISVSSNGTFTANFEKKKYPLTINIEGEGTVSEDIVSTGKTTEYDSGAIVKLTAVPTEGWRFIGWIGSIGEMDPTNNPIQLSIVGPKTVQATFEMIEQFSLIVKSTNGGIVSTEGGFFDEGTQVTVTATPDEGYRFIGWSDGSDNASLSITLNGNLEIEALFFSEDLIGSSSLGFTFFYFLGNALPQEWQDEFKLIMTNLNEIVAVTPRGGFAEGKLSSSMPIYAWTTPENKPFESILGNLSGTCICGNLNEEPVMVLEIPANEFIHQDMHRYSVIAHEFFHVYQFNASSIEIPYIKYLMEGGASTFESLYVQQFYNFNYFINAQTAVSDLAISEPHLFETFNDEAIEVNYSDSVFIFLALVKEIQKNGNLTEVEAFKKVYIEWWKSERHGVSKEVLFEEIFGFSMDSFYESLKSYPADINTVLPSANIRLQEIFLE